MRAAWTGRAAAIGAVALAACDGGGQPGSSASGKTPETGRYEQIVIKDPQQSAAFLAVADLDGDGRKEIVLSTLVELTPPGPPGAYSRGALRLFRTGGDAEGPWQEQVLLSTLHPQGVAFINTPQVMDVDGDGHLDIVVQTGFLSTLGGVHGWLAGPGFDGPLRYFTWQTSPLGNGLFFWHESAQVDLDGDGLLDIVTTSGKTQSLTNPLGSPDGNEQLKVEWYRNLGNGEFAYHHIADGVGGVFLKAHDVDGDGDMDIIVSQFFGPPAEPSVVWLENVEAPAAANDYVGVWQTHIIDRTIGLGYHMELVDLNGDGRIDLVVGSHNNDGDPRFQDAEGRVTTPAGIYRFEIPDNPRAVSQWTRHTVAEDFPVTLSYMNPASQGSPGIFAVGDIDGSGRLDLVVPGDGTNDLFAFRQRADGSFIRETIDTGKMFGMAVIADIDGNGRNEIIAAQHNSADGGFSLPPGKLAVYRFVVDAQ
jgi:hypothetical protein